MARAGERAHNGQPVRNAIIYEAHGRGVKQKDLAKTFDVSWGRIHQIIHKENRRRKRRVWHFSHLAVPIELEGPPRNTWLVSTLEDFDIDVRLHEIDPYLFWSL